MVILNKFEDVVGDVFGEKVAWISFDGISFGVDEELFKVPGDVGSGHRAPNDASRITHQRNSVVTGRWQLFSEPLEDGMGVGSVDHDFLHEQGFGLETVARSEVMKIESDFFAVAVLLMPELIARECQDDEAIAEALQQLVHL